MANIVQVTLNPAALQADGAYVSESIDSQLLPQGPNSGLIAIPGAANWGPVGIVEQFADYPSGVPVFGDTQITLSSSNADYGIMSRVSVAAAVASSFAAVRVTDGTDAAANTNVTDNTVTPAALFKVAGKYTGTFGNRLKVVVSLQSGTVQGYQGAGSSSYPVFLVTVYPPAGNAEVFSNIIGYVTGGAYDAPTFIANAIAAINGTNNTPPSRWIVASTIMSPSSNPPGLGRIFTLTSGTDGNSGLTDSSIVGTDGPVGTRTGMYAFTNLVPAGIVILPGVSAYSTFASLATFCAAQPCRGVWGNFPIGTLTATAVAAIRTNNLNNQRIMLGQSWIEVNDPVSGLSRFMQPASAIAAAMAATDPFVYVGNKPANTGMPNILATEDTITGLPIDTAEAGEREAAGLNWFAPGGPSGSGPFKTFHGMMSDGITLSSDVSAADVICLNIQQILVQFVGDMQGTSPNDATRSAARAKVNEYMATLAGKINAYKDTLDNTNNTPTTIAEGLMLCSLEVQTLGAVRFAIAAVQVGTGVQITASAVQ